MPHGTPVGLVLIIEDERGIANALALTLQSAGYETLVLEGSAGLGDAVRRQPFLVLLDLSLQESDAVDVLRDLAVSGFEGAVQLMSGSPTALLEQVRRVGEQRGLTMLPVLRKPFRMREIRSIAEQLGRRPVTGNAATRVVSTRSVLEGVDLTQALDREQLEVWYQPKYRARSHDMVGAECLVRIRHPEHGLVMPGAFLPGATAEELQRLTTFVLRSACLDWPDFKAAGLPLVLAVNVPCTTLADPLLAPLLRSIIPVDRAWPGLILEITEDQALQDIDAAYEASVQLKICGVQLSIDDFGLGYSSLARLRDIPFSEIKLDRTLVDGCGSDQTKAALCRTIVDMAHTLRAKVVAEGVEQAADLGLLETIGCDTVQGYFFAKPMMKADLLTRTQPANAVIRDHVPESMPSEGLR